MKKISYIFLLLVLVLSFSGCYPHGYYGHYNTHPYYYSSYPVIYQYVPVSPVIQQVPVIPYYK